MLSAVMNSRGGLAVELLQQTAEESGMLEFVSLRQRQLENYELIRVVNGHDADVVFLDLADWDKVVSQAELLASQTPQLARIGFLSDSQVTFDENPLPELLDAWLPSPSSMETLKRALWEALHRPQHQLKRPLHVFMPAKAGVGATTISMHVADALANILGVRTLFLDADLNSSVLELLLNVRPPDSLSDLLGQADRLSPVLWAAASQRVGKLHVLLNHLEQTPKPVDWTAYHKLLRYAGMQYDVLVADLPETIDDGTRELLVQAHSILLVTTMELPPMKLAMRRLRDLQEAGAAMEKVSLILNRWHRHNLSQADTEKLLSVPVAGVIPNDYRTFQAALQVAGFVNPESAPGRAIGALAGHLAGVQTPRESGARLFRRFVR